MWKTYLWWTAHCLGVEEEPMGRTNGPTKQDVWCKLSFRMKTELSSISMLEKPQLGALQAGLKDEGILPENQLVGSFLPQSQKETGQHPSASSQAQTGLLFWGRRCWLRLLSAEKPSVSLHKVLQDHVVWYSEHRLYKYWISPRRLKRDLHEPNPPWLQVGRTDVMKAAKFDKSMVVIFWPRFDSGMLKALLCAESRAKGLLIQAASGGDPGGFN